MKFQCGCEIELTETADKRLQHSFAKKCERHSMRGGSTFEQGNERLDMIKAARMLYENQHGKAAEGSEP